MNKKKLKLREKIKNRPKTRSHPKKKNKSITRKSQNGHYHAPVADTEEQGTDVMSQVIWDFAGPLLETCNDLDSEKKAISLAIFVWNATLLLEQERKKTLDRYLADCQIALSPEEVKTLSNLIDRLVHDKEARFASNHNKITNCTFGDYKNNRHIEVGYTME